MKSFISTCLFFCLTLSIQAQYGSYFGFSGGATYSAFQDVGIRANESRSPDFGLFFTAIYGYQLTDFFGFETGLQYTAKGGNLHYKGDSKVVLHSRNRDLILTGTRTMERNIEFHSLTIPLQATFHPLRWLQVGVGAYAGLGISSSMNGYFEITDAHTVNQTPLRNPYRINLVGSYFTDDRGPQPPEPGETLQQFSLEGELISHPLTAGPYYEHGPETARYINRFEAGLFGSMEFELKNGFAIGSSLNYQLTPFTNPDGELNYQKLDENGNFLTADESKRLWNATLYISLTF